MKTTLFVDIQFEGIEGKSRDNIIFFLSKIFKYLSIIKRKSDFNLEIVVKNVITKTKQNNGAAGKKPFKILPVCLN